MSKHYNHILVPLDGSELAESALADAFSLAQLSQAQITLLQVIPPIEDVLAAGTDYPIYIDQQWENERMLALAYLNNICKRQGCPEVTVHRVVEMGLAAETIIDYAHRQAIDLIVMATHGRSGLQRWVYGSVADKVLRGAEAPVLLVRAYVKQKAATNSTFP
jgi:nucleotide-binding universal stress UspA family protein